MARQYISEPSIIDQPLTVSQIVPESSSSVSTFKALYSSIPEDHHGMCKFKDETHVGYRRICGIMMTLINDIVEEHQNGK